MSYSQIEISFDSYPPEWCFDSMLGKENVGVDGIPFRVTKIIVPVKTYEGESVRSTVTLTAIQDDGS